MQKIAPYSFFLLLLISWTLQSCSTEFEVYAPAEDIYIVYCVLNPEDSVQYVRVARAYQVEGDAIEYAGANDLSVKNLPVVLKGNGREYTAVQVDNFPKDDGIFLPNHTVYQFNTQGADALLAGRVYNLEIGAPDTDIWITATDTIPEQISLIGRLSLISGAGTTSCLPKVALDRDLELLINKKKGPNGIARSFEIRIQLYYEQDGIAKVVQFGPTLPIDKNFGCPSGSSELCYEFRKYELYSFFEPKMEKGNNISLTYDNITPCIDKANIENISHSLRFEVTGMSSELTKYKSANSPAFTDLSGAKPEYSNMGGDSQAYGIFGAYVKTESWALFDNCGEWLLSLNGVAQPSGCTTP